MRKIYLLLMAFILFQLTSCETTEPQPPKEEKPPGYQEDIPWPSLADSPWPMEHHDPQNSGRSNLIGPTQGIIKWEFNKFHDILSGVAISEDSTIYYVVGGSQDAGLVCLEPNGNLKWKKRLGTLKNFTTPIITSENKILCIDSYKTVYCINSDSTIIWSFSADDVISQLSLNIGLDGTIYFLDNNQYLYAISSDGKLEWKIFDNRFSKNIVFRTSFSPDGKWLFIPGFNFTLVAFNLEKRQIIWTYGNENPPSNSNPVVDSMGRIYVVNSKGLSCIDQSGSLEWSFYLKKEIIEWQTPCITKQGDIYFGGEDTLYSIDYNGKLKWKKSLQSLIDAPIVCDINGNSYVSTSGNGISIFCLNPNGDIIWRIDDNTQIYCNSAAIGNNKVLYLPLYRNKIIKIK